MPAHHNSLSKLLACFLTALSIAVFPCDAAEPVSGTNATATSTTVRAEGSPREALELFGFDQEYWSSFSDAQPLAEAEQQKLIDLLFRLRQFPPGALNVAAIDDADWSEVAREPARYRGDSFHVTGRVKRVAREAVDGAQAQRLQLDAFYRCEMELPEGQRVLVFALAAPSAWKLDAPLDERASFDGLLIKSVPSGESTELVFAAKRVSWHPRGLLGDWGMDVGLFDTLADRTGLSERECFYRLLAAIRRGTQAEIDAAAERELAVLRESLPQLIGDRDLPARQRAAARRALARARLGASDVVPLFNEPERQRGKLLTIRGDALRAIEIRVSDPDVIKRFGIDHYYEVEVATEDSQNHPVVCCVTELPADMPRGEHIQAHVVVNGFFLKSWAYEAGKALDGKATAQPDSARRLLAPILVARSLAYLPPKGAAAETWLGGAIISLLLVAGCAVLWWVSRGDRRAIARARHADRALPDGLALDKWPSASDKPREQP